MRLRPFRALRYTSKVSAEISRRLLDDPEKGTDAERRLWTRQDPLHPLNLVDAPDPDSLLRRWIEEGGVMQETREALYVLEIQPAWEGGIRRRSPTRYLLGAIDPADDLRPLEQEPRAVPACSAEPMLAADDQQVLRTLLAEACIRAPAAWEARSDGHLARLWRLSDTGLQERVQQALDDAPVRPLGPAPERGRRLAAVIPLSDPGLTLRPVHRAIKGVEIFQPEKFLTLVREFARTYELTAPLTTAAGRAEATERLATLASGYHAVLLVLPGGQGSLLRFRQGLELEHLRAVPRNPTLRSLDLALLNTLVLRTVLGIQDPQAPDHPQVFPVPSLEQLVDQVEAGVFQAGFALNPPPLWEVRAVMEAAQELPPRTLRVEPVPPAGVLFLAPG